MRKMVIVADLDLDEGVDTCVLGYTNKDGLWDEIDVYPRMMPTFKRRINVPAYDFENLFYDEGWNDCIKYILDSEAE